MTNDEMTMNKRYNDTDLREALRRRYADTPQLSADFMARMERRMDGRQAAADGASAVSGGSADGSGGKTTGNKHARLWAWMAAAASILLIIGIGLHVQFSDWTRPVSQSNRFSCSIEQVQLTNRTGSVDQSNGFSCSIEQVQLTNRTGSVDQSSTVNQSIDHGQSVNRPRSIDEPTTLDSDPNLHYASADLVKDTVPYQDPARVDEYIAQLADYHNVKQGQLTCSLPVDSSVVSTVYVFPDKDEINLFSRLLQVACWYDSKTSGYHLNFSQEQFFFELKDMRRRLQYRWIAERINGRILLYSTHVPLGTKESSACYQEYRDELMYQNSINSKTKEI